MRKFKLEQTDKEITGHAGVALIGAAIENYTSLTKRIDAALPKRHGVSTSDLLKVYLGLLAQGKNDFEAVNGVRNDRFFAQAMGLAKAVPTEASLRTRFDKEAEQLIPLVDQLNREFLARRQVPITPLHTGHVAMDFDVTPHDNSNTKKDGVSMTYKKTEGYAPIAGYLGKEGWLLNYELRPGSQHSQLGFTDTLDRALLGLHQIMPTQPIKHQAILMRVDAAHDAAETRAWFYKTKTPLQMDFIIKWNPRCESRTNKKQNWLECAKKQGHLAVWETPRPGKRVVTFSVFVDENNKATDGKTYTTRRVMRLIERSIDRNGQSLLEPELEIEGWWTTLDRSDQEIMALYRDHATSEQFHSEIKTDLDLERLPSGKFNTNDLILALNSLIYNILRWIGLTGLLGEDAPVRHEAQRRRMRTVIQELIYIGANFQERGRQLFIRFGRNAPAFRAFQTVYQRLAYG